MVICISYLSWFKNIAMLQKQKSEQVFVKILANWEDWVRKKCQKLPSINACGSLALELERKTKKMFSSLCIGAFLPKGNKSRKMYKNTRGRGKRHKMDKQMWDKNKRDSRQRKAKKTKEASLPISVIFDMHIIHRKVLKWISAKKNSYTQLLCLQIVSKNSNYLCLWQWEAIIHNGPLFSPALFHSFLDGRNEIDILVRNTRL